MPDYPAFRAATDGLWNALLPTPLLSPERETAAESAATFPGSAVGISAAGYLTLNPYSGTDFGSTFTAWLNATSIASRQSGSTLMTGPLVIANAFQVTIKGVSGSQVVDNVIGVRHSGGTALAAATAVKAAWEGAGHPTSVLSNLYAVTSYHAVDLSSAFGGIADLGSTTTGSVATTTSLATMAACALVQWNGATRSRSTRGRLYFGPIMEQDINTDGRTLVTGRQTNMQTCFQGFRDSLNTAGYPLVVLSRTLSQSFDVTSHTVESVVATQRRRIR